MDPAQGPVVVLKVGGSLLSLPDLADRLSAVLSLRPESRALIVVGGGPAADVVRRWDALFHLSDEAAHWLAIRAMGLGEQLLAEILPGGAGATSRSDAETVWRRGGRPILRCEEFLQQEEARRPRDEILPRSWDVTSDSIAAWVARCWPADELVLLKSAACPAHAARALRDSPESPVDRYFAEAAASIRRLGWCDLRGAPGAPEIREWQV